MNLKLGNRPVLKLTQKTYFQLLKERSVSKKFFLLDKEAIAVNIQINDTDSLCYELSVINLSLCKKTANTLLSRENKKNGCVVGGLTVQVDILPEKIRELRV